MKSFSILLLASLFLACQSENPLENTYRPLHHFTPPQNWTNDPNGMVYLDGEYHFFYQYNPFGDKWGHMSWGHAVSRDLKTWEHLPLALPEFDNGDGTTTMIFSGSAVVDSANTSGFFEEGFTKGMVAIFTSHIDSSGTGIAQHQSLGYSADKGRSWKLYDENPVLDIGLKDFRDPNVIWNEQREAWLMAVVKPREYMAQFYESADLKNWTLLSEFGQQGDTTKIWECPSLFKVPVEGSDEKKWVLLISSGHKTEGFVGMQYFVGDFDGVNFTVQRQDDVFALDHGKDFYAAIPFNNLRGEYDKPVIMGWGNNWAYANDIPTVGFRGNFSFPRALSLTLNNDTYRLKSEPIVSEEIKTYEIDSEVLSLNEPSFHLHVKRDVSEKGFELKVAASKEEFVLFSYDLEKSELSFDRTMSGKTDFNKAFPSVETVKVSPKNGEIELDIYFDVALVEVFINGGEEVITNQIFPTSYKVEVALK
ncbi:glycoside hydrolase family 32 protein [Arcticibacterium luteifluviistationis]|uniref:Levanase n=1 Tax=Arcticibacterium luteifluviistationis TaxID=1784714 RepID=A0A2Z4GEQ7_9BACT|nr:glycoside hydrolase family 32 protein [Arcticibacterium luteifluviistationis]AWV99333.1 levanase [Arcticibacterium luteifluviistationis]